MYTDLSPNDAEFAALAKELVEFKNGADYDHHWGAEFDRRSAVLAQATGKTRETLINELWVAAA